MLFFLIKIIFTKINNMTIKEFCKLVDKYDFSYEDLINLKSIIISLKEFEDFNIILKEDISLAYLTIDINGVHCESINDEIITIK
jgi:hypothetical protein